MNYRKKHVVIPTAGPVRVLIELLLYAVAFIAPWYVWSVGICVISTVIVVASLLMGLPRMRWLLKGATAMNINDSIISIKERLSELRRQDEKYSIFGARSHRYQMNQTITEMEITEFESNYSIMLPEGYRAFLKSVGNGGAGPYYGLEKLQDSFYYVEPDHKQSGEFLNLSEAFLFTEPWNMKYTGDPEDMVAYEKYEDEYFSEKWQSGMLNICHFGCGVWLNLVVNGPERGNIWVDDRGSYNGFYPDPYFAQTGRTSFLEWYSLWLDISLAKLADASTE